MTFPHSVRRTETEPARAPRALGCRSSRPSTPNFVSVSVAPELGGILHVAQRGPARPAAPRLGARLWPALRSVRSCRSHRPAEPAAQPAPAPAPAASILRGRGGRELFSFSISYLKGEEEERMNELLTAAKPCFPGLSNACKYLCCGWSPPPRLSCLVCWLFVPNPGLCSV